MPFFSVIVPTYNRAQLLPRCLASLRRQTFADWEACVVDDGSTDDTQRIVEHGSAADHRICYVRQENRGAADARNHGAAVTRGHFLAFLDSDDEVRPEWLQAFYDRLQETRVQIVCCGCRFLNERGETWHVRLPDEPSSVPTYRWGFFFTGTFAIQRRIFEEVGGYTSGLPANQHSELRLRLMPQCEQRGWKLACVQEPMVLRYSHSGPNIRSNDRAIYESGVYILQHHGHVFESTPGSFATWAAAIGSCAARLGDYHAARRWFAKATVTYPYRWKNYLRLSAACLPGIRGWLWRSTRGKLGAAPAVSSDTRLTEGPLEDPS